MSLKKMVSNLKGFTLVELMVVVAIIGILAAVAIPNFKKYQAKAKTGEATLMLAVLYTGEQSALLQFDTYVACVGSLGLDRPIKGYYITGWDFNMNKGKTAKIATCVTSGAVKSEAVAIGASKETTLTAGEVLSTDSIIIPLKINTVGFVTVNWTSDFNNGATTLNGDASTNSDKFTAVAAGSISISSLIDKWSIDQEKTVKLVNQGY